MFLKCSVLVLLILSSTVCRSDFLVGEILQSEGHWAPSCRTVTLEYDDAGFLKRKSFRIKEVIGDDWRP
jgi:hypothetical protein